MHLKSQKSLIYLGLIAIIALSIISTLHAMTVNIAEPKNQNQNSKTANPVKNQNDMQYSMNTNLIQKMFLAKTTLGSKIKSKSTNQITSSGKKKKRIIIRIRKPRIIFVSESLCPFCKKYANEVLPVLLNTPEYEKLVKFRFVFWGNAKASWDNSLEKYTFECQHGEEEAYGNSMLTCANRMFPRKIALRYIYCMYGSIDSFEQDFDKTNEYCLQGNTEVISKVNQCMNSNQGNKWFYEDLMTSPDNTYVPYVIFDGDHDREKQGAFKEDPLGYLCSMRYNEIKNKDLCEKLTNERN